MGLPQTMNRPLCDVSSRLLGVREVGVLPTEKEARIAECVSGLGVGVDTRSEE